MPLGTEVGLGPGDTVLDGDPAPPTEMGTATPHFSGHNSVVLRSCFVHGLSERDDS